MNIERKPARRSIPEMARDILGPAAAPVATARVTQLRVGDESFLVASMIERCPKVMMLRELVKNALEAAATARPGYGQVRLSAVSIEGVPKLSIWNSGRGLDADELFRMCDIASSIRKQHRLDQNFGMGAKVASLPSNRHGLRYRSCHQGIVHEVVLGWRDGVYGRLQRVGNGPVEPRLGQNVTGRLSRIRKPEVKLQDVLEVSAEAIACGHALDQDWTEVVLFGNAADQDTVRDPYQGAPSMPADWLAEELTYRFFRLEPDVLLLLEQQGRYFEPLSVRIPRDYGRHETVTLPDGVKLHYAHDAPDPDPDHAGRGQVPPEAAYPTPGTCGLVYRDELYDVLRRQHWLHAAPVFGIPFGARAISVFIELPEAFEIVPDGYRQFLRYGGGRQGQVACRHFAKAVHEHRPHWLIAIIDAQAPSARYLPDIYGDLDRLLRDLKVRRRKRLVPTAAIHTIADPAVASPAAAPLQVGAVAVEPVPPDPIPPASTPAVIPERVHGQLDPAAGSVEGDAFETELSPQILMLRDEHEIEARGLQERAARYYPETHQLFLNGHYAAIAAMRLLLEHEFAWAADPEAMRQQALQQAERSMASRVGRMLVFALSKQDVWSDHDLAQACSAQALSLVADDFAASLPSARTGMQSLLA
ncbi:ATP-binding protein [Lichenicola sp.]|uniref:ATP-binding protein n=1 Tax=Lichenicola sp. TaxID=2804529 RepID=UPI003AFFB38B